MNWRRTALPPVMALVLAVTGLAALQSPAAAAAPNLDDFGLRPNAYGDALLKRADALPLKKATVTDIMNDLNRKDAERPVATGEACEPKAVAAGSSPRIFESICFDNGDRDTPDWYPQGVTSVADMEDDQRWGDSPQQLLVSWYDHDNAANGNKGVRISFVNRATGAYRHALLVYPKETSGKITYESLRVSQDPAADGYQTSLHAGGIVWYGNYLYVADTARGMRVFDMRRIFDLGASENGTTSNKDEIGLNGDMYYGHAYRYILPQVGSWTRAAGTRAKCKESGGSPNFSHISLDRSGVNHLTAGEWCDSAQTTNGRVASWAISEAVDGSGEMVTDPGYRWRARRAYNLPVRGIQGATLFNNRWYLSQSDGATRAGTLYTTNATTDATGTLRVESSQSLIIGPEDLSHWPGGTSTNPPRGAFWTVGEHEGKRMLYSTTVG